MSRKLLALGCCLLTGFCSVLTGCGGTTDGPARYQVQGTVNHNGSPLESGRITFIPDTEQGNDGPVGYALIQQGRYNTNAAHSKSPVAGPVQVLITGYDTRDVKEGEPLQPLFEDHRLSAEIDPEQKKMTLDFDVNISKK